MSTKVSAKSRINRLRNICAHWGPWICFLHFLYKVIRLPQLTIRIRTPDAQYPLLCRLGTSDLATLDQIFGEREYSCFDDLKELDLIIDCGANVGYASAYFLSHFPSARVVAVEPDLENLEMLKKNLSPYSGRFSIVRAGIWSKNVGLRVARVARVKGVMASWAITVREVEPGESADIQAVTIMELLRQGNAARIALLKIDIEGAEAAVFSVDCEPWLSLVDNMSIELHGNECRTIFLKAIARQNFEISKAGELTICRRE